MDEGLLNDFALSRNVLLSHITKNARTFRGSKSDLHKMWSAQRKQPENIQIYQAASFSV